MHIGVHILHIMLSSYQVFGIVVVEKFSVDIDNNALDITLDQFFLFFYLLFFILPIFHPCLLLGLYCLFFVSGG